jgi:hypothetical protein
MFELMIDSRFPVDKSVNEYISSFVEFGSECEETPKIQIFPIISVLNSMIV